MYPKKPMKKCVCFFGFSTLFLTVGIVLICIRTLIYNAIYSKMTTLQPNIQTFDLWRKNPVPITLKIHLFNWTNPQDINNSTVKPIFKEMGPYTFDETKEKVNITWNENNTVSYYNLKKWWFNPSKSNGSLNDIVTQIDPVGLTTAVSAKEWHSFAKIGLNIFISSVQGTHTAGEVLFDGYENSLLTLANTLPSLGDRTIPPFDKFGWFYSRNGSETYEGSFVMDTGVTGQIGELLNWKFANQTNFFPGRCGKVEGSAGEFFPSNLKNDTVVKFFSPDLCRFVELEFEKEVVVNGILGYKYVAADRFLDNGTKIPENKCFCKGDCQPYGSLDISACRYGSPAFVSLPHFHKADPSYTSRIEGVKSNKDLHDFFMIFEPKTGLPLHVSARLQLNLLLQPVPEVRAFKNVPKLYMPILWFEQVVVIPEEVTFFVVLLINFEVICLSVGIIIIFLSLLMEFCCCYKLFTMNLFRRKPVTVSKEEVPLNQRDVAITVKFKKPKT